MYDNRIITCKTVTIYTDYELVYGRGIPIISSAYQVTKAEIEYNNCTSQIEILSFCCDKECNCVFLKLINGEVICVRCNYVYIL